MNAGLDVTDLVERLEELEGRAGVQLDAISALVSEGYDENVEIMVRGEVYATSDGKLSQDVELRAVVYDDRGRVVGTGSYYFASDDFFTFDAYEIGVSIPSGLQLSRIRLFAKVS